MARAKTATASGAGAEPGERLPKAQRRRQLMETALQIVRDEGADRLTLGHLAERAGVSKPIAYDHFGTRSGLLIELYKSIDAEHADAMRAALASGHRSLKDTAQLLASAYVHCSANTSGEWQAIGAALAGSQEKDAVYQQLLDGYVQLFATALKPYTTLPRAELVRRCVGMIGAGEALSTAMIRGQCREAEAAAAFAALILGGLRQPA
ncbi:TetR/AcrR family transcriptional regulator [Rhodopseudomonas telluris]|uniref:TetR/AcrR family transcriptional regulator n=1 Tax=Rhodopseudomonas telluris TaxID=644215 RepID=A0ABV6ETE1_9BRAD